MAGAVAMAAVSGTAMAAESTTILGGEVTGNISVLSSYNLRGITGSGNGVTVPENDGATLQGGLDWSHESGLYLGYWASTLDYAAETFNPKCDERCNSNTSFESDFYGGYNGSINEDLGYTIGGTIYYYYPGWESTGYETLLGLSYKDFSFTAQTLLNNVTFGNKGDTYFLASYETALPSDFTGKVQLGAYYYGDDDEFTLKTEHDFAFRHLTVGLSHPLGETGADWSMDYILGGYDRTDTKQKNKLVLGLSYGF